MTSPQRIIGLRESVYNEAEWLALPAGAQWLYLVIARDPFVSAAGMGPVTARRWSNRAADQTEESVQGHLNALVEGGRAVLDEDYGDYVLLPKLLLDTGIAEQPNAL